MLHFVLGDSTAIHSPLNGYLVAMLPCCQVAGCRMPGCVLEANHSQANHATRTNAIPVLCAHAKPGEFSSIACNCLYYALTGICLESSHFRLSNCIPNADASPI
jgi:hypothetical protein